MSTESGDHLLPGGVSPSVGYGAPASHRLKPTVDEILALKPQARLRIYAWTPNDPPAAYVGLVKVGQTTRTDVNVRIRQSQGQMQQEYTLHVDVLAERED